MQPNVSDGVRALFILIGGGGLKGGRNRVSNSESGWPEGRRGGGSRTGEAGEIIFIFIFICAGTQEKLCSMVLHDCDSLVEVIT